MIRSHRTFLALAGLTLAAAAAIAALVLGHSPATAGGGTPRVSVLSSSSAAPRAQVAPRLAASLTALGSDDQLDLGSAREVSSGPGVHVVAAPAEGKVCFIASTEMVATSHCASNATFDGHGVGTTFGSGSDLYAVGLVPDGVSSVRATFGDGSAAAAPVRNNGFAIRVTKPIESAAFDGPAGHASLDLSTPGAK